MIVCLELPARKTSFARFKKAGLVSQSNFNTNQLHFYNFIICIYSYYSENKFLGQLSEIIYPLFYRDGP